MDREILYPNFKEFLNLFYKRYDKHFSGNRIIIFLGSHQGMEDFYLELSPNEWQIAIHRVDGFDLSQAGRGGRFTVEYKHYTMTLDSIRSSMKESKNFGALSSWPIAAIEADKFLVLK